MMVNNDMVNNVSIGNTFGWLVHIIYLLCHLVKPNNLVTPLTNAAPLTVSLEAFPIIH